MNEVESIRFYDWHKTHRETCPIIKDGFFQTRYTSTSLGTKVEVVCGQCGKSKDITDYKSW